MSFDSRGPGLRFRRSADSTRDDRMEEQGEMAIRRRLEKAQREGDLKNDVTPADFARYLSTIMTGLGIQAANGATKPDLKRFAAMALGFMGY
jgi:hypothetical protein